MKKIINIRGANASGKTTTVKDFISKYKDVDVKEIKTKNFKTKITVINKGEIIVLGKYDETNTCGCDRDLKGRDNLIEIVIYILKNLKPNILIYEGVLYGKTKKLFTDIYRLGKMFKYKTKGLYLYRELSNCIELLEVRNGGAEYNPVNILRTHRDCELAYNNIRKEKYDIKKILVDHIKKEDMYKILEEEVLG